VELRMGRQLTGENGISVSTGKVYSFPSHSHSYFELVLYHPFQGNILVNDTPLSANRPFAVLMTPADIHAIALEGKDADFIKIAFLPELLGNYLTNRLSGRPFYAAAEDTTLQALFEKMTEHRPYEELHLLLRGLLLCLLDVAEPLSTPPATQGSRMISRAIGIIHEEAHTNLTLTALAKRLSVSYHHLSASFTEQLGISFSAYLADVRLRNAKALLQNGGLSVTEVCYECGYRNLSHFLRSFKRKYGKTPKMYQKSR